MPPAWYLVSVAHPPWVKQNSLTQSLRSKNRSELKKYQYRPKGINADQPDSLCVSVATTFWWTPSRFLRSAQRPLISDKCDAHKSECFIRFVNWRCVTDAKLASSTADILHPNVNKCKQQQDHFLRFNTLNTYLSMTEYALTRHYPRSNRPEMRLNHGETPLKRLQNFRHPILQRHSYPLIFQIVATASNCWFMTHAILWIHIILILRDLRCQEFERPKIWWLSPILITLHCNHKSVVTITTLTILRSQIKCRAGGNREVPSPFLEPIH